MNSGGINIVVGITMLKVLPGQEAEAYRRLKNMESVKEVYRVTGDVNFFVILKTQDRTVLYRLVEAIKEMPIVIAIWNVLISKDSVIRNDEGTYPNWLKTHSKVTIC
jgi:DNA-binding Lrp family transcriptional regulator